MAERGPSSLSLWLDEALSSWVLPVAAIAAVVTVGLLYLAGIASEEATATLVIVVVSAGVALYVGRPALDARRHPASRAVSLAAAILTLVAAGWPALRTVNPGAPVFSGDMGDVEETISLPPGAARAVRL